MFHTQRFLFTTLSIMLTATAASVAQHVHEPDTAPVTTDSVQRRVVPVEERPYICFAPGTTDEQMRDAHIAAFGDDDSRWRPNDGSTWPMTTLRYSFPPDGISIGQWGTNSMHATFDAQFGSRQAWKDLVREAFDGIEAVSNLRFIENASDDGASWPDTAGGIALFRGDIRIVAGTNLDSGGSNTLAIAFSPGSGGDIVFDSGDDWTFPFGNFQEFRNVLMHELGHAIGLGHVCPTNRTKLMEPFLSTNFDGPQVDDAMGLQALYGADGYEPNDTYATASPITITGTGSYVAPLGGVSNTLDQDWYAFNLLNGDDVTITVQPPGVYLEGPQIGGTCGAGTPLNAGAMADLVLELWVPSIFGPPGGAPIQVQIENANPTGLPESVSILDAEPGLHYVVVRAASSTGNPQIYDVVADVTRPNLSRLYVTPGASDGNPGTPTSWATAAPLIDALNIARNNPATQELWLKEGTHEPLFLVLGHPTWAQFFDVPPGLKIYGGFAGDETSTLQRDVAAHPTILDGGGQSLHVLQMINHGSNGTRLDGLIITGGNANGTVVGEERGGGVYAFSSDLTAVDCVFIDNTCVGPGGGVLVTSEFTADFRFSNCLFINNRANRVNQIFGQGGGLAVGGFNQLVIDSCAFMFNSADINGAALLGGQTANWPSSTIQMRGCTFYGNAAVETCCPTAVFSGGVLIGGPGNGVVSDNLFWANTSTSQVATLEERQIRRFTGGWTESHNHIQGVAVTDPMFSDPDGPDNIAGTLDDNLRLAPGSPLIDAGNNTVAPTDVADIDRDGNTSETLPLDVAGASRLEDDPDTVDTGVGTAPIIDIGAYEFQGPPPGGFDMLIPPDGSTEVPGDPVLLWDASPDAQDYAVTIEDAVLRGVVFQTVVPINALPMPDGVLADETTYNWSVVARNTEGETLSTTPTFTFTTMLDCNDNNIDDGVELASGGLDCNANGVLDECDLIGPVFLDIAPTISPFGTDQGVVFHTVTASPTAVSDVTITLVASADLDAPDETILVVIGSNLVATAFVSGGSNCASPPDTEQFIVPKAIWNAERDPVTGDVVMQIFTLDTVSSTDCGGNSTLVVNTEYNGPGVSLDENSNGIPDSCECDGDANFDGVVDVNDISFVLFRLGDSGTPGEIDGDANGDGVVDVNDISYVLFRLGDLCP